MVCLANILSGEKIPSYCVDRCGTLNWLNLNVVVRCWRNKFFDGLGLVKAERELPRIFGTYLRPNY